VNALDMNPESLCPVTFIWAEDTLMCLFLRPFSLFWLLLLLWWYALLTKGRWTGEDHCFRCMSMLPLYVGLEITVRYWHLAERADGVGLSVLGVCVVGQSSLIGVDLLTERARIALGHRVLVVPSDGFK
jgi:hypothetical protein